MPVCRACGVENPEGFRFCGGCGSPLAGISTDRRERRVVSVLFCDLVGFTSRSERLDVEDVETFLSDYHRLLRAELERHGGTVEKFIGDAVMALFGAPTAHEDDAERAVRAALSIQRELADLRERDGIDLHVRVGVTTGEALVALGANPAAGEGMATGDVVNTAARLQSAAPVDGVLVDERSHRLTDRVIRYAEADPVTGKGKAEPVAVWRAIAPRSLVPEQARSDDLALVGRRDELASVVSTLSRSHTEPSTQLVTILGAPGIGKTRLMEELNRHVDDLPKLIRWRRGRSLAYGGGVAAWALGEMVKEEAGILESDAATVASDKLDGMVSALLDDHADRTWVTRHLLPLIGLGAGTSGDSRAEALAAWRRFVEAMAEDGPTVLVFEDVHWADDVLLEFIDMLAERAGSVPLLVVCTSRPELLERRAGWGGGKINAHTINLVPLSDADTARLVAELLGDAVLPADTQSALLERAEGNPLYAQEYVRMLRDDGALARVEGGWRLVSEPHGLPDTVEAIIAARLDTLGDAERRFIQDAAVIGRTAWLGAICALGNEPRRQGEELLHSLERKQLLRRARQSSVAGEVECSFSHALTQQVAYSQIRRPERADRHARAAEWIGELSGERDDRAELLAHHYATALALQDQAGARDDGLARKARDALAEAGRQALAVYASAVAEGHLRQALELTPADDPVRAALLRDHVHAALDVHRADEGMLRHALETQVDVDDPEGAGRVAVDYAFWLFDAGEGARGDMMLGQAAEFLAGVPYNPAAREVAVQQAFRLLLGGRPAEARASTAAAVDRAEAAGDSVGAAWLRTWNGDARLACGDPTGLDAMREGAEALAAAGHPKATPAHTNLCENLAGLGEIADAVAVAETATRIARRFDVAYSRASSAAVAAKILYEAGNWEGALAAVADAISGGAHLEVQARWARGRILLARGGIDDAEADAERLIRHGEAGADEEALLTGLALAASIAAVRGDPNALDVLGRRFHDRWARIGGMLTLAPALGHLATATPNDPRLRAAAELLPEMSRWRAPVSLVAGADFRAAADAFAALGAAPAAALAWLLEAESAVAGGRHADAAAAGERALVFFQQVGATLYIRRVPEARSA